MTQEYRHKKFDGRKRNREDLETPSSEPVCVNQSFNPITRCEEGVRDPDLVAKKKLKIENNNSELEALAPKDSKSRVLKRRLSEVNNEACVDLKNEIGVKREKIEKSETIKTTDLDKSIMTSTSPRARRGRRKTYSMRSEGYFSSDSEVSIEIKKEVIDINAKLTEIPSDAIEEICKFRSNMVRKFPKKDRTAKDQERRDKNTFACRRSRRVKKIEQFVVEEAYKDCKTKHLSLLEFSIRSSSYFQELVSLLNSSEEIIVVD